MLFNPLFVQIGVPLNMPAGQSGSSGSSNSKLNKSSYLFSDIIRVINENTPGQNNSKANGDAKNNLQQNSVIESLFSTGELNIPALMQSDNNAVETGGTTGLPVQSQSPTPANTGLLDLVKELLKLTSGINADNKNLGNIFSSSGIETAAAGTAPLTAAQTATDNQPANSKSINLLVNSTDLDSFLKNLFDFFPALKMISGGDKNFIVQSVSSKNEKAAGNDKQLIEDAIINLLQTNSSVLLNFNSAGEQLKIEITKVDDSASGTSQASSSDDKTNPNGTAEISAGQSSISTEAGTQIKAAQGNIIAAEGATSSTQNTSTNAEAESSTTDQLNKTQQKPGTETELVLEKTAVSTASNQGAEGGTIDLAILNTQSENKQAAEENTGTTDKNATNQTPDIQMKDESAADGIRNSLSENTGNKTAVNNLSQTPSTDINFLGADAKYVVAIKVISSETENVNSSPVNQAQNNPSLKNVNPVDITSAEQNSEVSLFNRYETSDTTASKTITLDSTVPAPVRELFEPPLTLKLSLKHQITGIEQPAPEGSSKFKVEIISDKTSSENIQQGTETVSNTKAEIPAAKNMKDVLLQNDVNNSIKTNAPAIPANAQPESLNNIPNEVLAPVNKSQITNSADGQAGSNDSKMNESIISGQKNINQNISIAIEPAESNNAGFDQKSSGKDQKNADTKILAGTAEAAADKLIQPKDKIANTSGQPNPSTKTIEASDLNKEISKFIISGESKSVVLQLKPDTLGKVKITMDVTGNAVHAQVEVENESVKQMVQSNVDSLKHSLNLNGLQLSSINVTLSGGQQKSNKSFTAKKKSQYTVNNSKIEENSDSLVTRNLGYNTYEYLA